MILDEYPKEVNLRDGSKVILRPVVKEDEEALYQFFKGLSKEDRLYLRDDVANRDVIRGWMENLDYEKVLPILAFDGDKVVADATLHRNPHGWMRHVGEIRMSVAGSHRGRGLARIVAAEIFQQAVGLGLDKLVAEMLTIQNNAQRVFTRLGFVQEAILKDHGMDAKGKKHDLIIMSNDVTTLWENWTDYAESVSGTWHMED
ncbi:MAG: GNAT family N-acetyltransferase [bacterium]|nr:MAG: GNAT family N-acetyltransferase [bacterium]